MSGRASSYSPPPYGVATSAQGGLHCEQYPLCKELPRPLLTLFQDALALTKQRDALAPLAFDQPRQQLEERLDMLIFWKPEHPDCRCICHRLAEPRFELLLFLEKPNVPADNNLAERDIRSVAATRACHPPRDRAKLRPQRPRRR